MTEQAAPRRSELTSPLAIAAYRSGYVYAVISGVMGIAGMLGELPGLARLAQPLSSWPRIPLLGSIALVAIGFALWQFLQQRYRSAFFAALIAELTAALSLVAQVAPTTISHDAMALASAVLVLAAATPLAVVSARRRLLPEDASVGIAGFILLAVAATLLIARATGITHTTIDMLGAGPSLQVLVAGFLIGSCYVALVWSRGLLSGDSATWLPTALGIAGVVTVIVLWRGLASRENDQVVALTRQAGEERRRVLVREAVVTAHSLHCASEWRASGASFDQQRRDIAALQRDVPGLEAAGWISSLGVIDTVTSPSLAGVGADSVTLAYVNRNCQIARQHRVPSARLGDEAIRDPRAGVRDQCLQWHDGRGDAHRAALPRCDPRYLARIPLRDHWPRPAASPGRPPIRTRRGSGCSGWGWICGAVHATLAAWPTQETVDGVRSSLPLLVLLMGFAVSGLVPVSVRFAQRSLRSVANWSARASPLRWSARTDGIWEWDLLTGGSVHSPGIWRYLGYDPESVPPIRDAWIALVHPEDQPRLAREIQEHLSGVRPSYEAEYRVLARDGKWHQIVDRGRVVDRTASGHPARMVGIKADVTVARSAAQAREAAEQRFREVFDSGFQFQLLLDRGGLVVEINQHALDEFGVAGDDVRGKLAWNTLWWQGNPEAQERLRSATAAAARGLTRRYEEEFSGPAGEATHIEIAVKSLTGESEEHMQLLLEARDLHGTPTRRGDAARGGDPHDDGTRRGAGGARDQQSTGRHPEFLFAHRGAIPATHPHYKYVGAIEREVARIAAVTRQLYETYRPEHDSQAGAAIATVIGDAVSFLEQVNRATGVHVVVELGRGPLILPLPGALLRQIAYNLVQNAIEASPSGGTVTVRTIANNGHFELRVRDHGAGIPAESRERIFEPFYSTKSGRLRTGGMGLGLALVRRTVTAAGGTIGVHDVEGEGCEFVVTLPLHATKEETA